MRGKSKLALVTAGLLLVCLLVGLLVLPSAGVNYPFFWKKDPVPVLMTEAGFEISVFAEGLQGARFITFGPQGQLFAAERRAGRIVSLADTNGDSKADLIQVFSEGLNAPHSLVFHDGNLYVGVPDGVVELADIDGDGISDRSIQVFRQETSGAHNTRTVLFLPDGRMVVAKGSSCNVCEERDPYRAAITVYDDPRGENPRPYATGLRNAVGLTLQPGTGELWATNNGRDLMGDDLPPDEIHRVREGADYGWPFCQSGYIEDPDLGFPGACEGIPLPAVQLQAHSAPLGLVFYQGDMFPRDYEGDLFVAFHGSWNRTIPTGYKVVRIPFEGSTASGQVLDFVWGWLGENGRVSGRPVGLAVGPEGALYISDDFGGRIYRVVYNP